MCVRRTAGHLYYSDTFPVPMRMITRDWCVACGEKNPMLSAGGWHFTQHALERALDMALDPEEIQAVLFNPQVKQRSSDPNRDHPNKGEIWAHGKVAAVVEPKGLLVVTFLWRGREYVRGQDEEFFRDN